MLRCERAERVHISVLFLGGQCVRENLSLKTEYRRRSSISPNGIWLHIDCKELTCVIRISIVRDFDQGRQYFGVNADLRIVQSAFEFVKNSKWLRELTCVIRISIVRDFDQGRQYFGVVTFIENFY
ncbi:Hypothetical predicted protein [Pelobates cultripes]|uniref:Uncharacterized protein n=1 Tax=Pelobates cultripes TaxID=61616 RepID=A0AAD1RAR4_PELCU|nr:Hypothetical predicted protein [Pelobates cultripes]